MSVSRVQFATGTYNQASGPPTSVSATWSSTTTAGSLLVAVLGISLVAGGGVTYTAPSGWVSLARVDTGADSAVEVWAIESSAARSGAETFTIVGDARDSTLTLIEYSSTNPLALDTVGADQTGNSTSATSGAVTPSASASLVRIAAIANRNSTTQGAPSNSFIEVAEVQSPNATAGNRVNCGAYERIHTDGSSLSTTVTLGTSRPWVGTQVVFAEAAAAGTNTTNFFQFL